MASRLYLRRVKAHVGASGHQQLLLARGPEFQTAVTNTVTGPTAGERVTDTAGGTQLRWLSRPFASGVTIADAITVNLWAFESNAAANAGLHVRIYRCDADGNVLSTIADSEQGTELGTTNAARNWTIAAGSVTDTLVAAGERLGLDVLINDAGGTMAAGHTVSLLYDDDDPAVNGDSYIDLTETITEGGTYYSHVFDDFDASSSNSYRDAPTGGIYALKGDQTNYDMDGSVATMVNTATGTSEATRAAYMHDVKVEDIDMTVEVETDKSPTGNQQVMLQSRVVDENNLYRFHVQFTTSNTVQCSIERKHNDVYGRIGSLITVSGLTHAPGTRFKLRLQTAGTNPTSLKGKVWLASESEPGTWDTEQTDSSANMQVAAAVGLRTWMESGSNMPVTVTWDNWQTVGFNRQSLTGSLTFTPAIGRAADRVLDAAEAALTFTGGFGASLLEGFTQSFNAALDFTGSISRRGRKVLVGSLDFTASATASLRKLLALSADLDFSGAVSRSTSKLLSGSVSPTGSISRSASKLLSGTLSPAGAITRRTRKALAAVVDFTGAVSGVLNGGAQQFQQALNASLSFTGSVSRRTGKVLAGSLSPAGAVAAAARYRRALTATLSPSGALRRSVGRGLAAVLDFDAALTRRVDKLLSAALSPAGDLSAQLIGALAIAFNATLSFSGSVARRTSHRITAALSPAASFAKTTSRAIAASLSTSAALARRTGHRIAATLAPSATMTRRVQRSLAATLAPTATLARSLTRRLSLTASLNPTSALTRSTSRAFSAALTLAGTLNRLTRRALTATVSFVGAIVTRAITPLRSRGLTAARTSGAIVSRVRTAVSRSSGSTSSRDRGSTGPRD